MLLDKYRDLESLAGKLGVRDFSLKEAGGKVQIAGKTTYPLERDLLWDAIKKHAGWEGEVAADVKAVETGVQKLVTRVLGALFSPTAAGSPTAPTGVGALVIGLLGWGARRESEQSVALASASTPTAAALVVTPRAAVSTRTTWGMISPAFSTTTVSPMRTSFRSISSALCRVARLTVVPASLTPGGTK